MNVVVLVNGREAIPVRAIPYMADSTVSADILVKGLLYTDHIKALHGLSAFKLLDYDCCLKVQPVEWRPVAIKLQKLSDSLARQERNEELTAAESFCTWKEESAKLLPSRVFVWKDEFVLEHFKRYRRLSNEELAQSYSDGIEMDRDLICAPDDSYTAEIMANCGVPNWREVLRSGIDECEAEGPFNPDAYCVYVPTTCEPNGTDTLSDVTFYPMIEQDEMLFVMQGFEHALKAGPKSDERQSASVESDDQQPPNEAIKDPAPDRFAQRAMQDGFDKVKREKNGERDFEAKRAAFNLTDERCIELARKSELGILEWIELTGVGIGEYYSFFLVAIDGVSFKKHEQDFIKSAPAEWQIDMLRDNQHEPLKFPCAPARMIDFIDSELCTVLGCFSVPDAFRQAVAEIAQATNSAPQVPDEAQEQTAHSGTSEVTPANDDEQGEAATSTTAKNPVTKGLVAWQDEVLKNWPKIAEYQKKPPARQVMKWLRDNGPHDTFPAESRPARDSLRWIGGYGGSHTLTIKRLGTVLSEWRKAGKIPA